MNRKEWIEYFEAINNRKPTIQECQQALLNGEFVMEGRQATFSSNGKSVTGFTLTTTQLVFGLSSLKAVSVKLT